MEYHLHCSVWMCLAGVVQADGQTHTDTRIIVIFAYVAFLEVSDMTYSSERDTQKCQWERGYVDQKYREKTYRQKTYWRLNISTTKHIDDKTYRWQNISETNRNGDKTYWQQKVLPYRGQNVSGTKRIGWLKNNKSKNQSFLDKWPNYTFTSGTFCLRYVLSADTFCRQSITEKFKIHLLDMISHFYDLPVCVSVDTLCSRYV
jgi:hypothetical protein